MNHINFRGFTNNGQLMSQLDSIFLSKSDHDYSKSLDKQTAESANEGKSKP
jgi:hypothetical protein